MFVWKEGFGKLIGILFQFQACKVEICYLQGKRGRPPKNPPKEDASEESAEDAE